MVNEVPKPNRLQNLFERLLGEANGSVLIGQLQVLETGEA
jgi:hypothetical protein